MTTFQQSVAAAVKRNGSSVTDTFYSVTNERTNGYANERVDAGGRNERAPTTLPIRTPHLKIRAACARVTIEQTIELDPISTNIHADHRVDDIDHGGRWDRGRVAGTRTVDRRRAWTGGTSGGFVGVAGGRWEDEEDVEGRFASERET